MAKRERRMILAATLGVLIVVLVTPMGIIVYQATGSYIPVVISLILILLVTVVSMAVIIKE